MPTFLFRLIPFPSSHPARPFYATAQDSRVPSGDKAAPRGHHPLYWKMAQAPAGGVSLFTPFVNPDRLGRGKLFRPNCDEVSTLHLSDNEATSYIKPVFVELDFGIRHD
jgi:hypothetical protein